MASVAGRCHRRAFNRGTQHRVHPSWRTDTHLRLSKARRSRNVCALDSANLDAFSTGLQAGQAAELPIFPLGIVAMPSADVPLQIFEARYRVLFNTLLAGQHGISEDLVQEDSPFKAQRRFGMCYASKEGLAACGTVLYIRDHQVCDDGRLLVVGLGCERFQLEEIVQEKPVLIARVRVLEDEPQPEGTDLAAIADPMRDKFRLLMQLNAKVKRMDVSQEVLHPKQLDDVPPEFLPFWMASMFAQSVPEQQRILEMRSARERLESVERTLDETVKFLSATVALESAFQSSPSEAEKALDDAQSTPTDAEKARDGEEPEEREDKKKPGPD